MLCVETPEEKHRLVGYIAQEDVIERVLHACDGAWPSAMFPETVCVSRRFDIAHGVAK